MFRCSPAILALLHDVYLDLILSPLSRRRQRQALQHLDEHLLRDIGLTRREARLAAQSGAEALDRPCAPPTVPRRAMRI